MAYSDKIAAELKEMLEKIKQMKMEEDGTEFSYVFIGATITDNKSEDEPAMDVIYSMSVYDEEELDEMLGFASHAYQVDQRAAEHEERFNGEDTTNINFWLNYGLDDEN